MNIEPTVVLSRINFIADNLGELRRFESITLEEYLGSFDQKIISERILELIIQAALDINEHLLTRGFQIESTTNKQSFINLVSASVTQRNSCLCWVSLRSTQPTIYSWM